MNVAVLDDARASGRKTVFLGIIRHAATERKITPGGNPSRHRSGNIPGRPGGAAPLRPYQPVQSFSASSIIEVAPTSENVSLVCVPRDDRANQLTHWLWTGQGGTPWPTGADVGDVRDDRAGISSTVGDTPSVARKASRGIGRTCALVRSDKHLASSGQLVGVLVALVQAPLAIDHALTAIRIHDHATAPGKRMTPSITRRSSYRSPL